MEIYKSENSNALCHKDGHEYVVTLNTDKPDLIDTVVLSFQDGAVQEVGKRNGLQNEEVLAILIHRMRHLQEKFSCRENAIVITKLEEALMWLQRRTALRKSQGVEGREVAHKS